MAGSKSRNLRKEGVMRKIVYPVAGTIITFLIFFIISMSLSPEWTVQRRLYINAKPGVIAPYVNNLEKWKTWNQWASKRGINSIALTCKLPEKTTCVVDLEVNHEIEECLVMLVPADFGAYVVLKVSGKMHENPLKRFIVDFHNDALAQDLENSLKELKHKVEKK
jgi:hypothetical protein